MTQAGARYAPGSAKPAAVRTLAAITWRCVGKRPFALTATFANTAYSKARVLPDRGSRRRALAAEVMAKRALASLRPCVSLSLLHRISPKKHSLHLKWDCCGYVSLSGARLTTFCALLFTLAARATGPTQTFWFL